MVLIAQNQSLKKAKTIRDAALSTKKKRLLLPLAKPNNSIIALDVERQGMQ